MAESIFLPVGGTVELPINYSYRHPGAGLGSPEGVTVVSDNELAATVALAEDGMGMLVKGLAAGIANISVKALGWADEVEVTVGDPQLSGLAIDSGHAVYEMPPRKTPVAQPVAAPAVPLNDQEKARADELEAIRGTRALTEPELAEAQALDARETAPKPAPVA